jgi:hypothetical protein
MKFGSATFLVSIEVAVFVQISERCWIWHPFVEVTYFLAAVHFDPSSGGVQGAGQCVRTRFAFFNVL